MNLEDEEIILPSAQGGLRDGRMDWNGKNRQGGVGIPGVGDGMLQRLGTSKCSLWLKLEAQEKREVGMGRRERLRGNDSPSISSFFVLTFVPTPVEGLSCIAEGVILSWSELPPSLN